MEVRRRRQARANSYSRYAKATFRKDRRLNIRLSSKDLEAIEKRALAEGLPYQTPIPSLLQNERAGRLKEIRKDDPDFPMPSQPLNFF